MKTAVMYARYSSDNQSEQSIEGQVRVCEEYAASHGIIILAYYIDRAMTGTNDNRPDFQRMIKDSAKKEWDYVLVYKFDRFSRNKYETAMHKKTLKDNGVKLISAMEYIPDSPEAIILESMLEGYAEYYSAELSQKVKRGMKETRIKGKFTGGMIIYGYNVQNHKVVINEEQAEVVRYIYEQYSLGVYVKDIISTLTSKGILNRNKPFARNTVYNILKNEKYYGIYRHNGEVFNNMYPPIVPKEIYDKVRRKVEQNKYGKRSTEVVYLLRNKLICGCCGSPVSAESGTSKSGQVKRYYKCLGRKRGNPCKKSVIRKDVLEEIVVNSVIEQLNTPDTINAIVKCLAKRQEINDNDNGNSILSLLLREKKQTENALNNVMTAIEQGIMNNTTQKRMKELENRQEELEKQIIIERSKQSIKISEDDMRSYYKDALKSEPQMLINYLIQDMTLFDDKIEIRYNNPLRTSPDDNRGFCFYSKIIEIKNYFVIKMKIEMFV